MAIAKATQSIDELLELVGIGIGFGFGFIGVNCISRFIYTVAYVLLKEPVFMLNEKFYVYD
jgi:hypothetical protein